jgi:UDPglucose 6-dehydrogenase
MRVLLVGAGHVGLCMGVVLASTHQVTLLDIDKELIAKINQCRPHIYEEGLVDLLRSALDSGNLRACSFEDHLGYQDIILVCVGTPSHPDGSVDLTYIENAIDSIFERISELCDEYCAIGIKSTVPPGTTRRLVLERTHSNERLRENVGVIFNPEFLSEGTAIWNAQNPDRIIIGSSDEKATGLLRTLYDECLGKDNTTFLEMDLESAESCKYVTNCFLATKISFANEIANILESVPYTDINHVMMGLGSDSRVSPEFLKSGAGWGGSCLPKDVSGLIRFAEKTGGIETPLLKAVQKVNSNRPKYLVDMLIDCLGDIKGRKITILGLAFKPGTDDFRESPSLKVIDILSKLGADVWVHDPLMERIQSNFKNVNATTTNQLDQALKAADGCILITSWPEYQKAGLEKLTNYMQQKIFIDGRRLFSEEVILKDVKYRTVGKFQKC